MSKSTKSILETNLLIEFPEIRDDRGKLTYLNRDLDFAWTMRRVFIIHDISRNATRANHAHKTTQQIILAASGSFAVTLFDGRNRKTFTLNSPSQGVFIPKMIWVELENFSENAVVLVLADQEYDEGDYIRDLRAFKNLIKGM